MWEWLKDNHGVVSALSGILTLVIWTLYFHLLYSNYRRLRRPRILINRGAGHTVEARCIVANMSAEAIYIEAVLISLGGGNDEDEPMVCSLSELDTARAKDDEDPRRGWLQGPLQSGELIDIGTYQDLIDKAAGGPGDGEASHSPQRDRSQLTITIAATYLSQDGLVAAEREFELDRAVTPTRLRPRATYARQIRSASARRSIERLMMRRNLQQRSCNGEKGRLSR